MNTKQVKVKNKQGNEVEVTMYWSESFKAYVTVPGAVRSTGGTLKPEGQRTVVFNERCEFVGYTADSVVSKDGAK